MKLSVIFLLSMFFSLSIKAQTEEVLWVYPEGIPRLYVVYVPAGYKPDNPVPLVMNIHGWVSTGSSFMRSTSDLRPFADTANFIVAYPGGLDFRWNSLEEDGGETDLAYLVAVLDDLEARYSIDRERIYATGFNDGGELALLMGCRYSDRIAAVASVKGSLSRAALGEGCLNSRPVPVLKIDNIRDWRTPFDGDARRAPVLNQVEFFAENNQCQAAPEWTVLPDIDPNDSITVERYVYSDCEDCADVEFILELDSTTRLSFYYPISTPESPYYFDSREEIWSFFRKYTLEGGCRPTSAVDSKLADLRIFPNPAGDHINIEGPVPMGVRFILYSAVGMPVLEGRLEGSNTVADISSLPSGMYYLSIGGRSFRIIKTE